MQNKLYFYLKNRNGNQYKDSDKFQISYKMWHILVKIFFAYPSCCMNGFWIDSMPSTGQISTTDVPLHTTKPSIRVSWFNLYGSSGSV